MCDCEECGRSIEAMERELVELRDKVAMWNSGWEYYDIPEHLGMDLRRIAEIIDAKAGYKTMDGAIIFRAASSFDGLGEDASYEDSRLALIAKHANGY